jgi:hypothetical protein
LNLPELRMGDIVLGESQTFFANIYSSERISIHYTQLFV